MGGAAKKIGRAASGVFTLGGSEIARNNLGQNSVVSKALQTPGMILTGGQSGGYGNMGIFDPSQNPSFPDFQISPQEIAANKSAITGLGDQQYAETQKALMGDDPNSLKSLLTREAQQSLSQSLPGTAEDYNAGHLLNSSGYGNEVARQQGQLAQGIANKLGEQSLAALQKKQGFGEQALSRGFSLEDFVRQANVAKTIGAQAAPQVGNGKGATGTLLSGVGSVLSPTASILGNLGKAAAAPKKA